MYELRTLIRTYEMMTKKTTAFRCGFFIFFFIAHSLQNKAEKCYHFPYDRWLFDNIYYR